MASTAKVCDPSASTGVVNGLEQPSNEPPSMLHWKLVVRSMSEKWKVACEALLGFDGALSMDGVATAVFTIQL